MIHLRSVGWENSDTLHTWRNLAEVRQWMFSDHLISKSEHDRWFAAILEDPSCRYWLIVLDGAEVGTVYLTEMDATHRRCASGLYIAESSARGRGVGRGTLFLLAEQAFSDLGMNRLESEVLVSNQASLALYEGAGFRREGFRRQFVFKSGSPADVISLALLESEWQVLRHGLLLQLQTEGVVE